MEMAGFYSNTAPPTRIKPIVDSCTNKQQSRTWWWIPTVCYACDGIVRKQLPRSAMKITTVIQARMGKLMARTVKTLGPLRSIWRSLRVATQSKIQRNCIINTSDSLRLALRDHFGAFTLVTCGEKNCLATSMYDALSTNVGTVDMDITVLDFSVNGQPFSMLSDLPVSTLFLRPGQSWKLMSAVGVTVLMPRCMWQLINRMGG